MKITRLSQAYDFPGYRALSHVEELSGDPPTMLVRLKRVREKKDQNALSAAPAALSGTTARSSASGTTTAAPSGYTSNSRHDAWNARSVAP